MKNKANLKALKRLISISISTSTSKSQSLNKANKAKTPQPQPQLRLIRRLQILVLLTCHFHKKAISMMLGCDIKTVDNLRKRFAAGEGIVDRHRSGRPPTISSDVTLRLIALYCQQNPLPGCNRWSINWLAKYVKKHPEILKLKSTICISRSSIYRRLKAHALRPYRIKYFLQISDSQFFEKMEKIIQVYAACYKYLFCIDECTGIQVLERIDPDLPQQGKHPEYKDSHYIRHGTVSIFSFLEVSTGRVFTECIPDHKSSTVIMAIRKHISQYDCNETIHYILDNYSSHSTEEFCREIAKLCNIKLTQLPELKTLAQRKEWLESASENKRIVFHFLPTHGSWLNLIEIWFGILKQKSIKDISFRSAQELKEHIISFTNTWNEYFAHPFKWTYTGYDLYGKVIRRFVKWLLMESSQLNIKFLKKQLKLLDNLSKKYWHKAKIKDWISLLETLERKNNFIRTIIENDENDEKMESLLRLLTNLKDRISENLQGKEKAA